MGRMLEGGKPESPEKNPDQSKDKNQQQTQPTYWQQVHDLNPGHIQWWKASTLTTVPPLLPYHSGGCLFDSATQDSCQPEVLAPPLKNLDPPLTILVVHIYLGSLLISMLCIFCPGTRHLKRRSSLARTNTLYCTMLWSIPSSTWPYMVQFGIKGKLILKHRIHTTVHFQPWLMIGDPSGFMAQMNSQHLTFLLDLYRYKVQVILPELMSIAREGSRLGGN